MTVNKSKIPGLENSGYLEMVGKFHGQIRKFDSKSGEIKEFYFQLGSHGIRHLKTAPERDLITHDVRDFSGNPN